MTDNEYYDLPFYESSTKCGHLLELGYENFTVFENPDYDSAIIGITQDNRVVYDYERGKNWKMYWDPPVTDRDAIMWGYDDLDDFCESVI